ncbi:MAG: DegT/DnrJ/EryC1/StrS family aminotransferase [Firmicutes bacterium]|nr:DegT/DnrJ/EryC1/StrS family aminotransferase [Candidatus Colimorpha enterica]
MPSDFRYNTGDTQVPWAAVGENYNAADLMEMIRFMMQGEGKDYNDALLAVWEQVKKLDAVSCPPGKLSLGSKVEEAEKAVAEYLGTDNATFLTNCTAGFEIACKYAGVKAGDEVIVPAITFIATMVYPLSIGAKLVFADVDPKTMNMDPKDVAKKITDKTKLIIPVHMAGYPVDMDPILELARKHNIVVLEDAAHGFGATYKGRKIGTLGDFASFSFHEVKNITSFGEGGVTITTIPGYASEIKRARFLGVDFNTPMKDWLYNITSIKGKDAPWIAATNCSTTEIQGLGLALQVARNDEIIAKRKKAAEYLNSRFAGCDAIIPQQLDTDDIHGTYHMYLIQIDPEKAGGDIQVFKKKLEEKGVTNIPHFGPLYRFKIIVDQGYDVEAIAKSCPVCEEHFYHRFTHLPLYGLSDEQFEFMADKILETIDEMQRGV